MEYMHKIKKMLCKELEEYGDKKSLSSALPRQVRKKDKYILICLTNLIKGDTIILPHYYIARLLIFIFPCQINHSLQGGFFVVKKIKFFSKKVLTNVY